MFANYIIMNKKIKCYCGHTTICDCGPLEEPKQETLEEAATNYTIDFATMSAFKLGAKWQQERIYAEADNIMRFLDTEVELKLSDTKTIERIKWYFETYFEQFKKK